MSQKKSFPHEISVVLCGEAGQGIQTIEHALTRILKEDGFYTFSTSEFMSRIRGGVNSTTIRMAGKPVNCYAEKIDILIALNSLAVGHLEKRIDSETIVIGPPDYVSELPGAIAVDFSAIAAEAGSKLYANTVAAGFLACLFSAAPEAVENYIRERFAAKDEKVIEGNITAARAGAEAAQALADRVSIEFSRSGKAIGTSRITDGAEAVALGAIAGGCDFVSSYPMSPSTGVLINMAQRSHKAGILVEQAEDEIAAINMALGAWYAGARALVTTSGGGFALMCEGVSLAGMLETPVVVHIGQRPGPATGLPTRTEQGDLDLALYAGHGEFPRIILAPGSPEQAFKLAAHAFNMADKYQIPVFILTDQYLLDSHYQINEFNNDGFQIERHIVKTAPDYKRYALHDSGISPRGIPGYGEGIVAVDSDEHTEEGYITESMQVRNAMMRKRLAKLPALRKESIAPERTGPADAANVVICWGSNYHQVHEAIERTGRKDIAMLHFSQVYPLPENTAALLGKAGQKIIIENNATGQFERLLKIETGLTCDKHIRSFDGLPFAVETIAQELAEI